MAVTWTAHVKIRTGSQLRRLKAYDNGPWIHVLSNVTVDQTDLNQRIPLTKVELPWIVDMAKGLGPTWACCPASKCHFGTSHVTDLWELFHQLSHALI